MGEVLSGGAAPFFNSAICVLSPEMSPNPPGEAENGSDCHSQRLDPLLRGRTERFGCGRTVWPLRGTNCLNMKTFVGRIITVSDGAGWSVTVSNWGVAQSSRYRYPRMVQISSGLHHCHGWDYRELSHSWNEKTENAVDPEGPARPLKARGHSIWTKQMVMVFFNSQGLVYIHICWGTSINTTYTIKVLGKFLEHLE